MTRVVAVCMALAPVRLQPEMRGKGRHILFADDDPGMRAIVLMNLEAEGFEVTVVRDGEAALAAIQTTLPDLIVLDVMMPGRDGYDVLRQLKDDSRTAGIPVVLLTAKAADTDVWEGWKSGADYYMTKPFDPDELARFAHHVLRPGGES